MSRPPAGHAITLHVDGRALRVEPGISVAAALENARLPARRSVSGAARGPLCGMGSCHECRVTINGIAHQRACLISVAAGMEVRTGE